LLALLQPFADARQRTPEELEALVRQHLEAQHVQGPVWRDLHAKFNEFRVGVEREILAYCDAFYLDTLEAMGPWVAHHMRDWFCEFRDLLTELCVTMVKFTEGAAGSWGRATKHYRMVTLITKTMAHMHDVPTQHTGKMTYQAYKDPLNRRVQYLEDKAWMRLLEDTAWIVLCANGANDGSVYAVNPRVLDMIAAYRAALTVIEQKAPWDMYVQLAHTQTAASAGRVAAGGNGSARQALLELQALYDD
jgi:hypothetical protein